MAERRLAACSFFKIGIFCDKDGNIRKNHLSSVTKYKIRSNMARGLVLFEICMLLLLGSFYRPVFWVGISLLLLNSFLPPVISTLFAIFRAKERQGLGKFYCSSGFEVVTAVDMALTNIDAVVRTLYRMKNKSRLLELGRLHFRRRASTRTA